MIYRNELEAARARVGALEADLARMTEERDAWRDAWERGPGPLLALTAQRRAAAATPPASTRSSSPGRPIRWWLLALGFAALTALGVAGGDTFWFAPFLPFFPVLSVCSVIAWVYDLRERGGLSHWYVRGAVFAAVVFAAIALVAYRLHPWWGFIGAGVSLAGWVLAVVIHRTVPAARSSQ